MATQSLQNRDHRVVLSKIAIRRYVDMFHGNEFCFMCRSLLRNKVFENGLDLCEGSSGAGACRASKMPRTQRLLEDHWIPFGKAAMDMIFCIGLVPVRFIRVDEKSIPIPYVPIVGTYDIHIITTKEGVRSYELYDTDSGLEPVQDALVLGGFNYDPHIDGQMTSLVSILEPVFRFIAELSDAAIISERIRSNPPIVIQKRDSGNAQEKETANFGFYADTDNIKMTENNQFQRDEMQVKQLQNQQRLFMNALYPTQGQQNAKNALDNMVPLPSQFQVGTMIEPSGRTDFVSVNRMAQETICSTLGVPRSLFINDHVVRSDQEGVHETLRQSLIFWKQVIASMMTKLWRLLNEESVLKKVMKDAKKSKRALQGIALESHLNKKMPRIEIPITPYCDSGQLRMLYLQGVISWETYATYLLRNSSLPKEILATKTDPFSFEDKKLLLGIKPEPVAPPEPISNKVEGSGSGSTDEHGTKAKQSSRVDNGSKTMKSN